MDNLLERSVLREKGEMKRLKQKFFFLLVTRTVVTFYLLFGSHREDIKMSLLLVFTFKKSFTSIVMLNIYVCI